MAIINKITVPVTLVNGRATITYPLTRPKPTMVSTVNAKVSAPMNLNNSINVPIGGYVPPPPEKFTITSNYVSGASSVTFTVKSDKLGSDTTVEYRLFEGTTVGTSNHKRSGTLKLANGTGLINYSILSPKPTGGASNVICLVESPSVVQSTVSIPKYTPPYVPPPVYSPINFTQITKDSNNTSGVIKVSFNTYSNTPEYAGTKTVTWTSVYTTADGVTRSTSGGNGSKAMAHGTHGSYNATYSGPVPISGKVSVYLYVDGSNTGSDHHYF